ncbi:MAG: phage coat protein [Eubacterium sp.]|nr:phage coat protein [Eubacterium sp.]
MAMFDSKIFNPEAFGKYVEKIPNANQNALAKSKAVSTNPPAKIALGWQSGGVYATVPYFGRIDGSTSQNNDGGTNIVSTNTSSFKQGFVVASRMDAWTERSFSSNITAGIDFMDNVASQISEYKNQVMQSMLLAMLKGIFGQSTTGNSAKENAARQFIEKHTYNITELEDGMVNAVTLNKAIQRAGGDNKNSFKLVIMHSEVATNLENLNLLEYMKYTDKKGITQDLGIATWNGRTVLIDDHMPTEEDIINGEESMTFTTYVLGENSIILDNIGDQVPYEMSRDPKTNGGQDTLYVRDRYLIGASGLSFADPLGKVSVTNEDLENGNNWSIITDGNTYLPHKSIAIARIISRG